jgi:hypothetical protein
MTDVNQVYFRYSSGRISYVIEYLYKLVYINEEKGAMSHVKINKKSIDKDAC